MPCRRMVRAANRSSQHRSSLLIIQRFEGHVARSIEHGRRSIGGTTEARAGRGARAADRDRRDPEGDLQLAKASRARLQSTRTRPPAVIHRVDGDVLSLVAHYGSIFAPSTLPLIAGFFICRDVLDKVQHS